MKKLTNKRGNSFYQPRNKKVIFPPIETNKMKISSKDFYGSLKKRNIVHNPDYNKKLLLDISSYKNIIKKKENEIKLIENQKEILDEKLIFNEKIAENIFLKDIDVNNAVKNNNIKIFMGSKILNQNNEQIANNYKINVTKLEDKKKEYLESKNEVTYLKNELVEFDNNILNIERKISQKKNEINNQKNKINIAQNNKNQREEILEKEKQLLFEKNNLKKLNEEIKQNENILNENNLKIKNNDKEIDALKKELEDLKKNI